MGNDNINKFYSGYDKLVLAISKNKISGDILDYFDKNMSEEDYFLFYVLHRLNTILAKYDNRNYTKFSDFFDIDPHIDEIFSKLETKVIKRQDKVIDNCVAIENIISTSLSETIYSGIMKMNEHSINSLIILEDGKVAGLFTYRSPLDEYLEKREIFLNREAVFADISEYLSIETLTNIKFIKKDTTQRQMKKAHNVAFAAGNIIDFYFITEDGTKDSKLLGMLSPSRFLLY